MEFTGEEKLAVNKLLNRNGWRYEEHYLAFFQALKQMRDLKPGEPELVFSELAVPETLATNLSQLTREEAGDLASSFERAEYFYELKFGDQTGISDDERQSTHFQFQSSLSEFCNAFLVRLHVLTK